MSMDMRYQMLCGLDGEWRLRSETLRKLTDVYQTQLQTHFPPADAVTPAVSMLSMGDARRACSPAVRRRVAARPLAWVKRFRFSPPHPAAESKHTPAP